MKQINIDYIIFEEDYKTQFTEIVSEARDKYVDKSLEERYEFIESLTGAYIDHTGERPDSSELYNLADIYLYDYLEGDVRQNKMYLEEYPILTLTQLLRRTTGQGSEKTTLGFVYKEVSLESAFSIGSDGNNHSLPIRYFRE